MVPVALTHRRLLAAAPVLALTGALALTGSVSAATTASSQRPAAASLAPPASASTAASLPASLRRTIAENLKQSSAISFRSAPIATYNAAPKSYGYLGYSVAISANGDTVAVGAPYGGSAGSGYVYIYAKADGRWPRKATAVVAGDNADSALGTSVAVSANGDTIVAGSPGGQASSPTAANGTGGLTIYTKQHDSWKQRSAVHFTGAAGSGEQLGASVAISANGEEVVAGAPFYGGSQFAGLVNVYSKQDGSWGKTPSASLQAPAAAMGSGQFGAAVAVSGSGKTIIGDAPSAGIVAVYKRSGETWPATPTAQLASQASSIFLHSVAIAANGTTVAAGSAAGPGVVEVWTKSASGAWPTAPTARYHGTSRSQMSLGAALAVSANGKIVVAGEPGYNDVRGRINVYAESRGAWPKGATTRIKGPSGLAFKVGYGLGFGVAISSSAGTVVGGAPGDVGGDLNGSGHVYLYGRS